MHRKSLSRSLNGDLARRPLLRQRGRTFGLEVERAWMVISESFYYLCSESLKPKPTEYRII